VNPSPKWPKSNEHPERSCSGIRIPPGAYRVTVLNILGAGDGLDRAALAKAARNLFGYGRTSPALEEAIGHPSTR
jgi:hypothetical protein